MNYQELLKKLDAAFGNYFEMSEALKGDLAFMLDIKNDSIEWKRNYIRSAIPLVEGYCRSFREVTEVYIEAGGGLHNKQEKAAIDEQALSSHDRIKLNIKTAHTVLLDDETSTDFGNDNWVNAKKAIAKRGAVMHPKSPADLDISEDEWTDIESGITWLVEEVFGIYYNLHARIASD